MASVGHLITSEFLSGQDVSQQPQVVHIASAEIRQLGDDQKVVVGFAELDKELPCNKTRLRNLIGMFGDETDAWLGKPVMIYGQQLATGKYAGQWTVIVAPAPKEQPQQQMAAMDTAAPPNFVDDTVPGRHEEPF